MSDLSRKLWLSLGLAALLIIATVILQEVLAASIAIKLISPFSLLALIFASYAFISFISMIHEDYQSQAWKSATVHLIISALIAISLGTGSGWVAGIGLAAFGIALVLPLDFLKKEDSKASEDQ